MLPAVNKCTKNRLGKKLGGASALLHPRPPETIREGEKQKPSTAGFTTELTTGTGNSIAVFTNEEGHVHPPPEGWRPPPVMRKIFASRAFCDGVVGRFLVLGASDQCTSTALFPLELQCGSNHAHFLLHSLYGRGATPRPIPPRLFVLVFCSTSIYHHVSVGGTSLCCVYIYSIFLVRHPAISSSGAAGGDLEILPVCNTPFSGGIHYTIGMIRAGRAGRRCRLCENWLSCIVGHT